MSVFCLTMLIVGAAARGPVQSPRLRQRIRAHDANPFEEFEATIHRAHREHREELLQRALEFQEKRLKAEEEDMDDALLEGGDRLPLVPYPASVKFAESGVPSVLLSADTQVLLKGVPEGDLSVKVLREHLRQLPKPLGAGNGTSAAITLSLRSSQDNAEGYELSVSPKGVEVSAPGLAGLFYGVQTLRQLMPNQGPAELRSVTISDSPRLAWRGLMLDCSRHFFNAEHVKKLLETMASFKLNHFHWHLSDDQGWRIPIEAYPKLTEVGSEDAVGRPHHYTKEEIKDVIAFAAERHITVLPEIDVPGHSGAAIAAYPELGNTDIRNYDPPKKPYTSWGVHEYTLGPSEQTTQFLTDVFDEVSHLFPGPFVHTGGDEAPTKQWDRSEKAQSLLLPHVQSSFNALLAKVLHQRNKTMVAWDEAQHMDGLADDAVVLAWRSTNELKTATRRGHRAINADMSVLYFDHYQGPEFSEPKAICCYTPLETVYEYDPVPRGLSERQQQLVLGSQAQLWAEYFPTFEQVEYMAFPRSLAFAERVWTPNREIRGFTEFEKRLQPRLEDLDKRKVNYRRLNGNHHAHNRFV